MNKVIKKTIKIKIVLVSIALLVLTCGLAVTFAYTIDSFKPTYGTTTTNVNFRYNPSTNYNAIKVIPKNTNVKLVGTIGNFYIVQLNSNEVGLLSKDYIKSSNTSPKDAKTYTSLGKITASITNNNVNFRQGPGTNFKSIQSLNTKENITIIGQIDNWYIAISSKNNIGAVYKDYVKLNGTTNNSNTQVPSTSTSNIEIVLKLINDARTADGLPKLKLGATLPKVAQHKADDMVKNNYFSHTSPTYGSPFDMMKKYNVSYLSAGENIAGNPSIENAVSSWLNSSTHKQNLLSPKYNYIGIGITKSDIYGYIIVAMFAQS